ncbi:MAG: site-2 protease family protein [Trueperaceae bacterium]|nr:MAG: site-2 protease family protein [Trueperaceae bacterium]
MTTALIFISILLTAVLVHELAHYLNARSVGVPVRAFSIGMGPVIYRRVWQGTEWRISLLPLGGYVDLPGMAPKVDENGKLQHPEDGMAKTSFPEKVWVLLGGVIANFLLGILIITAVILLEPNYRTITSGVAPGESGAKIVGVIEGSHAEEIGLSSGDTISSINGIESPNRTQVIETIQQADQLILQIDRSGSILSFTTPWPPEDSRETPLLGIQLEPLLFEDLSVGPWQAVTESASFGVRVVPQMIRGFVAGFGSALIGRQNQEVAGPVGIVNLVNQARRIGVVPVLFLAAIINFSLAVFNLLPIPGLDGGRILLATIVAIRGKPFKPGQEETIHFLGFMAVLALIVLVTFNEISGILRG